jgi:uncharacterized tellurite resistance protein B-like protein
MADETDSGAELRELGKHVERLTGLTVKLTVFVANLYMRLSQEQRDLLREDFIEILEALDDVDPVDE